MTVMNMSRDGGLPLSVYFCRDDICSLGKLSPAVTMTIGQTLANENRGQSRGSPV